MGSKKSTLSVRDLELASLAWQCFENEPKMNYKKFAEVGGFKNTNSATAVWATVKKKLLAQASSTTSVAPKSNKRKKDAETDEETLTKKPRTHVAAKAKPTVCNDTADVGKDSD
ncbi:hypothetical protein TruAng_001682 [Truncatella angustata]|nr:hypothetical protein TruAng_001682 [Truncatella angustata]